MMKEILERKFRYSLVLFVGLFSVFSAYSQSYHFIVDYGIFSDNYKDISAVETHVDSFKYKLDVPLRDDMVLKMDMGVEWMDINKRSAKDISAYITRPYDPPLRLIKVDKVKLSGSNKLKSLLFKGMFRSGSKLVRIDMYVPLPKK